MLFESGIQVIVLRLVDYEVCLCMKRADPAGVSERTRLSCYPKSHLVCMLRLSFINEKNDDSER